MVTQRDAERCNYSERCCRPCLLFILIVFQMCLFCLHTNKEQLRLFIQFWWLCVEWRACSGPGLAAGPCGARGMDGWRAEKALTLGDGGTFGVFGWDEHQEGTAHLNTPTRTWRSKLAPNCCCKWWQGMFLLGCFHKSFWGLWTTSMGPGYVFRVPSGAPLFHMEALCLLLFLTAPAQSKAAAQHSCSHLPPCPPLLLFCPSLSAQPGCWGTPCTHGVPHGSEQSHWAYRNKGIFLVWSVSVNIQKPKNAFFPERIFSCRSSRLGNTSKECSLGCPFSLVLSLWQSAERRKEGGICHKNTDSSLPTFLQPSGRWWPTRSSLCFFTGTRAIPVTKCLQTELSKIMEWFVIFASLSSLRGFVLIFNTILIFNTTRAFTQACYSGPLGVMPGSCPAIGLLKHLINGSLASQ